MKIYKIPQDVLNSMIDKKIWLEDCPVHYDDLRLVRVSYVNFNNKIMHNGEIIVHKTMAEPTLRIFEELLAINFPINSIKLIDEYNGCDISSMEANNSSGFNYRKIIGSEIISMHSYGLAIDVNPLQNPYIINDKNSENHEIFPKMGKDYLDRKLMKRGMITEEVIKIFAKNKFTIWGGSWKTPVDYHHFQTPRSYIEEIIGK